jgi:hypothetical protein
MEQPAPKRPDHTVELKIPSFPNIITEGWLQRDGFISFRVGKIYLKIRVNPIVHAPQPVKDYPQTVG